MAATQTAKFDVKTLQTEATRGLYAYAGVTDLAVEVVRDYVADLQTRFADVQKSFNELDFEPQALRAQATKTVNARFEALSKEAKVRRASIEKRVAELRAEAAKTMDSNVHAVVEAYDDLVKRGESIVERIRNQESTQATLKNAKTAVAKAKTTRTQAEKAVVSAETAAKKAAATRKAAAKKTTAATRSSAKSTVTAAKKTAASAAKAVVDAAEKIGD